MTNPNDRVFPDVTADEIRREMVKALTAAEVAPAFIYAFLKTERIVTKQNKHLVGLKGLTEWDAAIDEFDARLAKGEDPLGEALARMP